MSVIRQLLQPYQCQTSCSARLWTPLRRLRGVPDVWAERSSNNYILALATWKVKSSMAACNNRTNRPGREQTRQDPAYGMHSLVNGKVVLQPKQMHHHSHYVNASRTSVPDFCTLSVMLSPLSRSFKFAPQLIDIRMNNIYEQVHNVALNMFGKRHKKVPDWSEAGVETNNLRCLVNCPYGCCSMFV